MMPWGWALVMVAVAVAAVLHLPDGLWHLMGAP